MPNVMAFLTFDNSTNHVTQVFKLGPTEATYVQDINFPDHPVVLGTTHYAIILSSALNTKVFLWQGSSYAQAFTSTSALSPVTKS
jgi:hypothetical protein